MHPDEYLDSSLGDDSNIVCRGAWELNSNCRQCDRCRHTAFAYAVEAQQRLRELRDIISFAVDCLDGNDEGHESQPKYVRAAELTCKMSEHLDGYDRCERLASLVEGAARRAGVKREEAFAWAKHRLSGNS